MYIWGYLGGPEWVFDNQTVPILLFSYPLTHNYVQLGTKEAICQLRKQSDKKICKFKPKI